MFRILCLFAMVCYVAYTSVPNTQIMPNLYLILKKTTLRVLYVFSGFDSSRSTNKLTLKWEINNRG